MVMQAIDMEAQALDEPLEEQLDLEEPDYTNIYWAARPGEDVITELDRKERAYFDFIARKGFGDAWLGAYCAYYGIDPDSMRWESHSIGTDGEQGELLRFRINEMRSYVRQAMTMAIGQRPAFEAVAVNDDYGSLAGVEDADTAINYLYWAKYGERKERRTIEKGDLFGLGYTEIAFDVDGGEEIEVPVPMPPSAGGGPSPAVQRKRTGELIIRSLAPWDLFYEPTIEEFDDHFWRTSRHRRSKWELAARHPEHSEDLLAMNPRDEFAIDVMFGFDPDEVNSDELVVKTFYHKKTRALPEGRLMMYVGKIVLYDGPLPYRSIPFVDYCPAEFIGTAFGYAEAWDLIPLNQMLDQVASDVATNVANLGRAVLAVEEGIDVDVEAIANGMRCLAIPPGMKPPEFLQPPPLGEGAKFIFDLLNEKFASVSGMNPTARGQSTSNITSGEMAALFHSIAIEVNSGRQMAVDSHRERVANLIREIYQDYVEHPFMLDIVGNDDRTYAKEISPEIFKNVQKIIIKTANPMTRTQAGRMQKGQLMLQVPGAVETPEQFDELLVSGQLRPLYKAPRAKVLRVNWENEQLRKGPSVQAAGMDEMGQPLETVPEVPVLLTDPHDIHMPEHLADLSDPRVLLNDAARKAFLAHVFEHFRTWKAMDPALCAILKIPAPPSLAELMGVTSGATPANDNAQAPGEEPMAKGQQEPRPRDSTGVPIPKPAEPPASMSRSQSAP